MTNIDKNRKLVKDTNSWNEIKDDISELQLARSEDYFNAIKLLWLKKHKQLNPEFALYFEEEHLQREGWYEGRAIGYPSTNNGLESTNCWIKQQGTFRQRLPMGQLLQFMLQQWKSWSTERSPNCAEFKIFASHPSITLSQETQAFIWIQGKPDIKFRTAGDITIFFISAANQTKLKEDDVNKYLRMTEKRLWKTFATYKSFIGRLWMAKFHIASWSRPALARIFLRIIFASTFLDWPLRTIFTMSALKQKLYH